MRQQLSQLTETERNLSHLLLIARDQELGLQNALDELVRDRNRLKYEVVAEFRDSTTWKVGMFFTWPIRLVSSRLRKP